MRTPLPVRVPIFGVVLAALWAIPLRAQDPPPGAGLGEVRGIVFDSTRGEPLSDAAVFLFGTGYQAISDAEGRFALVGIPAGRYTVLFYHPRLGELGASAGPSPVEVPAGASVQIELGTPSWFTLVSNECLLEARAEGSAVVVGWVGDGESGVAMPGAVVTFSWNVAGSREPARRNVMTDEAGWYRFCDAPGGTPMTVSARGLNRQAFRREISVPPAGRSEGTFLLWEMAAGSVAGTLRDAESAQGVAGAEVRLRGTSLGAVSGRGGAFRIGAVPPGEYTLVSSHLFYGERTGSVAVPPGGTVRVEMLMGTRAIELPPLTVIVEAPPPRRASGGGVTITRDQIARVGARARDAAELIQALALPGVIVRRRGDDTLCVGYAPGQARMMAFGGCVPMEVYVNDVHATSPDLALLLPPEAIERIVLYRPVEAGSLFPVNAANGVLVIYTRR